MIASPSSPIFLSVIIPAYNEERRILRTLMAIDFYLSSKPYTSEIIVVSDGSQDATVSIVEGLKKLIPNLVLLSNPENHGKGYVVRQGMLNARGVFRVFSDADNSTAMEHVEKMWPLFREGYQVVIGSRDIKGAVRVVRQSRLKEWLGDFGNLFIQMVAGLEGLWDTQCGFKGFSQKAAEDIFSRARINRWGFDVEALAIARAFGYRIREIPVYWVNDPFSHVAFSAYIQVLWETVKIRWNIIRGVYGISQARADSLKPQAPSSQASSRIKLDNQTRDVTKSIVVTRARRRDGQALLKTKRRLSL